MVVYKKIYCIIDIFYLINSECLKKNLWRTSKISFLKLIQIWKTEKIFFLTFLKEKYCI